MVDGKLEWYAVVFADVAGSTSLYERLGDVVAEARISKVVNLMVSTTQNNNGVLIKTIGDEIMCRFKSAADALRASCEIQLAMQARAKADDALKVRIGIHYGQSIIKDGDLFGDTVNVAARMAGLALAEQIITTQECVEAGATLAAVNSRRINALYVKGKEDPIDVYEVLWRAEDDGELTTLFSSSASDSKSSGHLQVTICYAGRHYRLSEKESEMVLGRGAQCDVEVASSAASRAHAKLLISRDKIILVDQSTNGTFVKLGSGEELFVHKEELPLTQTGVLSLGIPSDQEGAEAHLLSFSCEY